MLNLFSARPRVLLASALAVGAVALFVHPTLARAIGADVWNVPTLKAQARASADEGARLSDADEEVLRRIEIKDAIVADLIAGRATLAQATDRFTELNASRPNYLDAIRAANPGATDRESFARNVMAFAVPRAAAPDRDALASRLETELRQMLAAEAAH